VAESGEGFFKGFNALGELKSSSNPNGLTPDPLYLQHSGFQAPREVRLQARFTF